MTPSDLILDGAPREAPDDAPRAAQPDVRVGRRVRALRLARGLSLAELAGRAGMSVGALSQIERGLSSLRVRTLWPLAAALEVDAGALVEEPGERTSDLYVVRREHRRAVPVRSEGIAKALLSPPGAALSGLIVTVEPGSTTGGEAYRHAGHEFGLVLSGGLVIVVDEVAYELAAGDSFAFRSTLPHRFSNPGEEVCEILWVNTTKPGEARRDG